MTTMSNLASYAPSAYELLQRIGLERRRSRAMRAATRAGWIGVGMAMGSGLAFLLSSRNGRERIAETARRAREYVAPSEGEEMRERTPSTPSTAAPGRSTRRV